MPNTNTHNYFTLNVGFKPLRKRWWMPKSPEYLSDRQLMGLSNLMLMDALWIKSNPHQFLLQIAQVVVTSKRGKPIPSLILFSINDDDIIVNLYPLLAPLIEGVAGERLRLKGLPSDDMSLKKPLRAVGRFRRFFGPRENLRYVTFAEFIRADNEFKRFLKTDDTGHLHRFVACLYRPGSVWNWLLRKKDLRKRFDNDKVEKHAAIIARIARKNPTKGYGFIWSAVANFIACTDQFSKLYKHIYPDPDEKNKDKEKSSKPASWRKTIVQLAGFDPTKIEEVGEVYLHNALATLNEKFEPASDEE